MWRHKTSKHDRIKTLSTKHVKDCVGVIASYAKVCKLGQSVRTHNHMMFQNRRSMIIPTTFVFNGIQRDTQKYLRDILSSNGMHTTQNLVQCIKMKHKHENV